MKFYTVVPSAMMSGESAPEWPFAGAEIQAGQFVTLAYPSGGLSVFIPADQGDTAYLVLNHAKSGESVAVACEYQGTFPDVTVSSYIAAVGEEVYKSAINATYPGRVIDLGEFLVHIYETGGR